LQHDALRAEDLDSDGEDHAADETRYACMSRPWIPNRPADVKPRFLNEMTFNELLSSSKKTPRTERI
jgi:hypothetical protein